MAIRNHQKAYGRPPKKMGAPVKTKPRFSTTQRKAAPNGFQFLNEHTETEDDGAVEYEEEGEKNSNMKEEKNTEELVFLDEDEETWEPDSDEE